MVEHFLVVLQCLDLDDMVVLVSGQVKTPANIIRGCVGNSESIKLQGYLESFGIGRLRVKGGAFGSLVGESNE